MIRKLSKLADFRKATRLIHDVTRSVSAVDANKNVIDALDRILNHLDSMDEDDIHYLMGNFHQRNFSSRKESNDSNEVSNNIIKSIDDLRTKKDILSYASKKLNLPEGAFPVKMSLREMKDYLLSKEKSRIEHDIIKSVAISSSEE